VGIVEARKCKKENSTSRWFHINRLGAIGEREKVNRGIRKKCCKGEKET